MNRRTWIKTRATAALCSAALISSACAAPAGSEEGTVLAAALTELSGSWQQFGIPQKTAFDAAITNLNEEGGLTIGGQKIKFEYELVDDRSDPTSIAGLARQLADKEPAVIVGPDMNGGAAFSPFASKQTIYFAPDFALNEQLRADGPEKNPRLFTPIPFYAQLYPQYVAHLPTIAPEVKSVAVIYSDDNPDLPEQLVGEFKAAGYETTQVSFPATSKDYAPFLNKIRSQGVDMLAVESSSQSRSIELLRQAARLEVAPYVWLGSTPEEKIVDVMNEESAAAKTTVIIPHYGPTSGEWTTLPGHDPAEIFEGRDNELPEVAALVYYALRMTFKAMAEAGTTTDGNAIAKKLQGMKYDGPLGECELDADNALQCGAPVGVVTKDNVKIFNYVKITDDQPEGIYECTPECVLVK